MQKAILKRCLYECMCKQVNEARCIKHIGCSSSLVNDLGEEVQVYAEHQSLGNSTMGLKSLLVLFTTSPLNSIPLLMIYSFKLVGTPSCYTT